MRFNKDIRQLKINQSHESPVSIHEKPVSTSLTEHSPNRLQNSASPYLRSAAHQPIDWHEWNDEAFARAKTEDKPILLDIGAVWCHWCHVIDRESYENSTISKIINEHFVAIKVDRDERPDVDSQISSLTQLFDIRNGGFGKAPKFPHCSSLDLILEQHQQLAARGGDAGKRLLVMAETTLEKMAHGGMYDQLAGGFHRYSVDEKWLVPHFEKIS